MLGLEKKQLLILIGVLLILFAIPLGIYLLNSKQIFRSKASELKPTRQFGQPLASASASQEVPATSPLSDLRKLLNDSNSSTSLDSSPNPEPSPTETPLNISFGPTLTVKLNLEGRPVDKQQAKVFIGVGSGSAVSNPTYLLTFTIDFPSNGVFRELSLAGLNPGSTYTVYIKGPAQLVKSASFVMSPTISTLNNDQPILLTSGDLNEDNVINSSDYSIAKNAYGSISTSTNWNPQADLNADGAVNNFDLVIIFNNMSKTGESGVWQSTPLPTATPSASINTTASIGGYEATSAGFADILKLISPEDLSALAPSPTPTDSLQTSSTGYWMRIPN